jgi:nucleotide-binding universal stress UspA family protein
LLYRPWTRNDPPRKNQHPAVDCIVATLASSEFSERILPFAASMAKALNAKLQLVQVLSADGPQPQIADRLRDDVLESAYLHRQAREVQQKYKINADWDVLHGNPAEAIINYLQGRNNILLAMTTRGSAGLHKTFLGSVSSECLRCACVPMLVYHPAS